jgi:tRNA threonylcarbamoyladenosine biosynthesis protein TsaB
MALILQLETATTSCSAALALDGEVIACRELNERNIHASHVTLFIQQVMADAGESLKHLHAVAISMGPGSYTGLRIGVSAAKGLCYALDISLIAVGTLEAMASGMISSGRFGDGFLFCPMIDARRMEVFTAVFNANLKPVVGIQAKIIDDHSFEELLRDNKIVFFGDGALKCAGTLSNKNAIIVDDFVNSAKDLSSLAFKKFNEQIFEDAAYFEPFYLKDFVAGIPKTL